MEFLNASNMVILNGIENTAECTFQNIFREKKKPAKKPETKKNIRQSVVDFIVLDSRLMQANQSCIYVANSLKVWDMGGR